MGVYIFFWIYIIKCLARVPSPFTESALSLPVAAVLKDVPARARLVANSPVAQSVRFAASPRPPAATA